MEIICIDYLSLERSKGGIEHILVITDHFTRYAQAYPTKNQTAKTTAKILLDQFIVHYGFPFRIHSDQGANFESNLIKELCILGGTNKSHTTPYHAMGNGMVERFIQTLLKMLGTFEESKMSDWKSFVVPLVHAFNVTIHNSTGFSPYFLMFGRQPKLAIDALLGINFDEDKTKSRNEYVRKLRD
jgi:transposase InsO family protein